MLSRSIIIRLRDLHEESLEAIEMLECAEDDGEMISGLTQTISRSSAKDVLERIVVFLDDLIKGE